MNPRFLDHFRNPRNVGELEEATAQAEVENPVCGDRIRVAVRLDVAQVAQVAYWVEGCSGAIASASVMSELASDVSLSEARTIDRDAIDAALGGLPQLKRHGADLAADGLRAALAACAQETGGAEAP